MSDDAKRLAELGYRVFRSPWKKSRFYRQCVECFADDDRGQPMEHSEFCTVGKLLARVETLERALNDIRWKRRGGMVSEGMWACAECRRIQSDPEDHAPDCNIWAALQKGGQS